MKKKPMNNWKQRVGLASSRKTPLRDMLQPNVKYGLNKENKPLPSAKMLPPSRTPRGANFKSVTAHLPTPGKTGKYQFQLYWFTLWFLCGFQWWMAFASEPFRFLSIVCFKKMSAYWRLNIHRYVFWFCLFFSFHRNETHRGSPKVATGLSPFWLSLCKISLCKYTVKI